VKATLHPFSLPLRRPLRTAVGEIDQRNGFLLEVEDDDGHRGWGEAAPLPGWPGGNAEEVGVVLRRWCDDPGSTPRAALAPTPIAAAAVDTALISLGAARAEVSLAVHLAGSGARSTVPVNALIADTDPDAVVAAAARAVADGFGTIKLKVARSSVADDVTVVDAVRRVVGPDVALRLDANRGWTHDEARRALVALEPFDIEFVEEPTADLSGWPDLAGLGVTLAADESMSDPGPDPTLDLIREGHVGVLVAKIPLLSGVGPTLAAVGVVATRRARVVITSFLDTAVGLAAATHVAAALGPGHPAAGLATGHLLARDVAPPLEVRGGSVTVPTGVGLGIIPDLQALGG